MKRLQRATVLLSLVENLIDRGSWCGETHIQKATYFLQRLLDVPLKYQFILYKHGPFSFDLGDEILALQADTIFQMHPQPYPYGPSIIPGEGSEWLKSNYPKTLKKYLEKVKYVADKLGHKGVTDLERLATALYVRLEGDASDDLNVMAARINELKPHIPINEAQAALTFADRILEEARS